MQGRFFHHAKSIVSYKIIDVFAAAVYIVAKG
jgi:hypothetical protein